MTPGIPFLWKLGGAVALALALFAYHKGAVYFARKDGVHQERILWQEKQRRAEIRRLQEKQQAEGRLSEIESESAAEEERLRNLNADLEARLQAIDDRVCLPEGTVR